MKFNFVIPPINHMDLALYNDYKALYCLAHLCLKEKNENYQDYIDFFAGKAAEGYHVILDNSAAEADLVTEDVLIDLTKKIMPSEVIAPDYLYDKGKTIIALQKFHTRMQEEDLLGKVQIHAVPQGNCPESYLMCYLYMLNCDFVDVIGLSKLSVPKSFACITDSNSVSVNRRYLVKMLNELQLLRKPIHLLGMRNITEYKVYKGIEMIRSTDSCYTILAAMDRILLKDKIEDHINETPHSYFFRTLDHEDIRYATLNIDELTKIIESTK